MKIKLVVILILLGQFAFGQNKVQKIDSLMNALFSTHDFNGNVLVAEKGKILYSHSFGFANETTKEKLTVNSIFETGSVSKQFTAMVEIPENGCAQRNQTWGGGFLLPISKSTN